VGERRLPAAPATTTLVFAAVTSDELILMLSLHAGLVIRLRENTVRTPELSANDDGTKYVGAQDINKNGGLLKT
jgi:hypothetical protein